MFDADDIAGVCRSSDREPGISCIGYGRSVAGVSLVQLSPGTDLSGGRRCLLPGIPDWNPGIGELAKGDDRGGTGGTAVRAGIADRGHGDGDIATRIAWFANLSPRPPAYS